jgi:hypothetical protein
MIGYSTSQDSESVNEYRGLLACGTASGLSRQSCLWFLLFFLVAMMMTVVRPMPGRVSSRLILENSRR